MQNTTKFSLDLEDSPSHSKEAWPADYVKSELCEIARCFLLLNFYTFTAVLLDSSAGNDVNRKRKGDWMQQTSDFGAQLAENGPQPKVSNQSKERDRRKSQGECPTLLRKKRFIIETCAN
jgi:hypothetical protein